MATLGETIDTALAHHRSGRLAEAERIYRALLAADPHNAGAQHLLGVIALQTRDFNRAVDDIRRAIEIDRAQAAFHANLGEAYRGLGKLEEAQAAYAESLRINPNVAESQNNLGTILQAQGKLDEAIACYQAAIAARPAYADAHNNLGIAWQQQGQPEAAIASFERAVAADPKYVRGYYNLGNALQSAARLEPARAALERAIALQETYVEPHYMLGLVLQKQGQFAAAEAQYRRALALAPRLAVAELGLGTLFQAQGKLSEAIEHYAAAVALKSDYAEAFYNWGTALVALDRQEEAAGKYRQAVAAKANFPSAYYNLGTVLQLQKRHEEARQAYEEALRLQPDLVAVYNNLGNVYHALGNSAKAIECYRTALAMQPESGAALNNLGSVLAQQGISGEVVSALEGAVRANPDRAETYNNLGNALHLRGDMQQALECFQKSLELAPAMPAAHHNLGVWLLASERFVEGWPEYAWRLKCDTSKVTPLPQPMWQGEDLAGRTLLIYSEQGIGDVLQMVRYVPLARRRGGRVLLKVPPALEPLLRASGFDSVLVGEGQSPHFDLHLPIMSLPVVFKTTLENMPRDVPYLAADPKLVSAWRDKLARFTGLKVGISWQGNRAFLFDYLRSIPLAHFAPLARIEGVQLLSLQKYVGTDQLVDVAGRFPVYNLGPELDEATGAFMDTAAVMKNLDLVITSDTAVAHLAGALGVRTWVALAHVPDWRWFLGREDCPWYPSMRLFRQRTPGDWPEVFQRMAGELAAWAAARLPFNA